MTKYIYKGKEISRLSLIRLMRSSGIAGGYRVSHYQHLQNLAQQGNATAQAILKDLCVEG